MEMNSASIFLKPGSHGEVAEMTGAHTRAGQIKVLQRNGVSHIINAAGWPVVARAVAEGSAKRVAAPTEWRSHKAIA